MAEFASKSVAGTALGLGIGSTAVSLINSAGGLAGLFGFGPRMNNPPPDPGDKPVTRYELGLVQENNALKDEIVGLKAAKYTDAKAEVLQGQISQQGVFNATAVATMNSIQQQVAQLQSITQIIVPNRNVEPGWGRVEVIPAPPPTVTPPTVSSGGTATTGG